MGMVAGSGDPALQEMAGHITLFIVCCKAKARGLAVHIPQGLLLPSEGNRHRR